MKPPNKINRQGLNIRPALKIENDFWRWWKEQGALKEKGAVAEQTSQAKRAPTPELTAWADDGGSGRARRAEA